MNSLVHHSFCLGFFLGLLEHFYKTKLIVLEIDDVTIGACDRHHYARFPNHNGPQLSHSHTFHVSMHKHLGCGQGGITIASFPSKDDLGEARLVMAPLWV